MFDWALTEQRGKSEYPFSFSAIQTAKTILNRVISQGDGITSVSNASIECIVNAYMEVNSICLPGGDY